jgi:DNA-directed RNA polymerase specialized sigma subunit
MRLSEAFNRFSERDREIYLMHLTWTHFSKTWTERFHRVTYKELGDIFGLSSTRISQILGKMHRHLTRDQPQPEEFRDLDLKSLDWNTHPKSEDEPD